MRNSQVRKYIILRQKHKTRSRFPINLRLNKHVIDSFFEKQNGRSELRDVEKKITDSDKSEITLYREIVMLQNCNPRVLNFFFTKQKEFVTREKKRRMIYTGIADVGIKRERNSSEIFHD